jgi:hypothetical protein
MFQKLLVLLMLSSSLTAQDAYFEKIYGSAGSDYSRSVKQIASGSIYVLGDSDSGTLGLSDVSLSKLDVHGNLLWTKYYGTVNRDNGFYLNKTTDGNFVFVAETEAASNNLDILIYKIDTAGAVIWNKSFISPVNETPKYIEQLSNGGFILCGTQNDISGSNDILVVQLDSNGDYVWHQNYGRTDNDYSDMIHQVGNDLILTADTRSYGAGGYDVILYKLDSTGNEIWKQTYGDSLQNGCQGLLVTSDGNYLSYGETEIFPFSAYDFYLEKIDTSGGSIWKYTYGGTGSDAIFSAQEDADGGFICTGYSNSYNGGGPIDLVILKVDANGVFQWKQTYGGPGIDIGFEIIKANDNPGFIITGQTFSGSDEYYLLKMDENGIIGIPENSDQAYVSEAFPNPSSSGFSVNYDLKNGKNFLLVMYEATGKKVFEKMINEVKGTFDIDVSSLAQGIYFYGIQKDGSILSMKKIIVSSNR